MAILNFAPISTILDSRALSLLRRRLLAWFDRHQRDLPWRRDRDPYRIWISEVMLQQTTVAMAAPRYESFLRAFPTLAALAAADEQEVLRHWQGLGYYRRARHLHAAARQLMSNYDGRLPDDPDVWFNLPGVGQYILGAVLSQAFDRRLPIVEANSVRVLCRLFGQGLDPKLGSVRQWLWHAAEKLLPRRRVGDFNQALMELGALTCTPTNPRCTECPIAQHCIAKRNNLQNVIPLKTRKTPYVNRTEIALIVRRGRRVLFVQRPAHGRWSNMWEFPHVECPPGSPVQKVIDRFVTSMLGLKATIGSELMVIRHGVMRERITMHCLEANYRSGSFRSPFYIAGRWLLPNQFTELPVSSPHRKLVALANAAK